MNRHPSKSCGQKRRYGSSQLAAAAILGMARTGKAEIWELHPYLCNHCGNWHVGHMDEETQELAKANVKKKIHPLIKLK